MPESFQYKSENDIDESKLAISDKKKDCSFMSSTGTGKSNQSRGGMEFILLSLVLCLVNVYIPLNETSARADSPQETISRIEPGKFRPVKSGALSIKGKEYYEAGRCDTCHSIDGKGGCIAPPLDGIGARRSRFFVIARITDDRVMRDKFNELYSEQELMPHIRVPAPQANAIASYLLTLSEPSSGFLIKGHAVQPASTDSQSGADQSTDKITTGGEAANESKAANEDESGSQDNFTARDKEASILDPDDEQLRKVQARVDSIENGRKLFSDKGCIACHSIGELGGRFAPALDGIGSRLAADSIKAKLTKAEFLLSDTADSESEYSSRGIVMPPLNLSEKEMNDLTSFLKSLH
jgi:cytochrome c2